VASAELRSEHPLGKAIVSSYKEKYNALPSEPNDFKLLPGKGVYAEIQEKRVYAGNENLILDMGIEIPKQLEQIVDEVKNDGCTIIYAAIDSDMDGLVVTAKVES